MHPLEFTVLKKPTLVQIALLATGLASAALVARYYSVRRYNGAERMAEALLETERLTTAARSLPDASETVLAACAAYLIQVAFSAAEGQGLTAGIEDPIGYSRTHRHAYTQAVTTVLTETHAPEHRLTYAVNIPEVGEVRGTRQVGGLRVTGLSPSRSAPDTAQITLGQTYTAQIETEFEIAEYLVTGQTRLFGTATFRDNKDNVGRIHIGFDGAVTGTITRNAQIIGRFEGKVSQNITFRQYQLPPGE